MGSFECQPHFAEWLSSLWSHILPPGENDCSLLRAHIARCSNLWSRGWYKLQELHWGRRCPWFPSLTAPHTEAGIRPLTAAFWAGTLEGSSEPYLCLWQTRENLLKEETSLMELGAQERCWQRLETFGKVAPHNVFHLGEEDHLPLLAFHQRPGKSHWLRRPPIRQPYLSFLYASLMMLSRFYFSLLTLCFFLSKITVSISVTEGSIKFICFSSTWHGLWHITGAIVGEYVHAAMI